MGTLLCLCLHNIFFFLILINVIVTEIETTNASDLDSTTNAVQIISETEFCNQEKDSNHHNSQISHGDFLHFFTLKNDSV